MNLTFNPSLWHSCEDHNAKTCHEGVNCYSYILNRPDYYWAVPGLGFMKSHAEEYFNAFNKVFSQYSAKQFRQSLIDGAVRDGLVKIDEPLSKEGYYLAILVFSNDEDDYDFHWYRQDDNGEWSHKNGWHTSSNVDDDGNKIHDPLIAVRKEYPDFGGFFLVPKSGIKLVNDFPV